jgi:hypothetical protein
MTGPEQVEPGHDMVVLTGPAARALIDQVRELGGDPLDRRVAIVPGGLMVWRAHGPSRDDLLAGIRADLDTVRELLHRHVDQPHQPDYAAGEGPV